MLASRHNYEAILEASHHDLPLNPVNNPLDFLGAMDKVGAHDEETQGSGSGSGFSDFSALENETDDFGRQLLQHQRDVQRLNNALRGGQQAFRKARPKPRVAEMLDREEREREARVGQNHLRIGSAGSNDSEPPVTVPREWGRKARKQTDWMRKILEPSENGSEIDDETAKPEDEDAIYPHRTLYTGDLDWRDSADEPVQSIEDTPPSMRRRRQASTPSSLRHMNTTIRPNDELDNDDFTGTSLLASTPATRLPRRKIDELAQREIEDVERRAVATRNLGRLDDRSRNTTRRSSSSLQREHTTSEDLISDPPALSRPLTAPGKVTSPSRIPRRQQRNLISNKENIPLNGNRVNDDRRVQEDDAAARLVNRTTQAVNIKNAPRPAHVRNDSMNLLKKLARVSSISPSPGRDKDGIDTMDVRRQSDEGARPPQLSRKADRGDAANEVDPRDPNHKTNWEQPEDIDQEHQQMVNDDANDIDKPPAVQGQPPVAETPKVAGAWIDTTLNAGVEAEAPEEELEAYAHTATDDNDLRQVKSEPANPKSALEEIMREAKAEDGVQQFGESTIQSLEDIVHPNLDPTDTTIMLDFGAAQNAIEYLDDGHPLSQPEKDRRQENLAMEAMNKHLRAARTSIKDANRGLRRVENRIETAQEDSAPSTAKTVVITKMHGKHSGTKCEVCGRAYESVWKSLWAEFRSCFYTYDSTSKYGFHFTTLGLTCFIFMIWYLLESIFCFFYCRPAYSCFGCRDTYGHNPPIFPFVLPTLFIYRPFKYFWDILIAEDMREEIEDWLTKILFEDTAALFVLPGALGAPLDVPLKIPSVKPAQAWKGIYDRTRSGGSEWIGTVTAASARAAQSVVDAVDEVGKMWDDEIVM